MLVLTRKKGESIMIGDQIELIVLGTEGDTVKLGLKAPKQVEIYRKEIYEAIKESNRVASSLSINVEQLGKMIRKKK